MVDAVDAAAPRLLAREQHDLDAVAEPIGEGRRVVAFVVCPAGLRSVVTGYLSMRSGRVIPEPTEAADAERLLALLSEAADAKEGEVRSVALDASKEDTVRALNWHREKLRRGASVLVWIADVEGLRVVRRLAPDAYSFRDTLAAVGEEREFSVVPADVEHADVRLARLDHWMARAPRDRIETARNLANALSLHQSTEEAQIVVDEALAGLVATPISTDEDAEAEIVANWHLTAAAALFQKGLQGQARRYLAEGLSVLRDTQSARAKETRLALMASCTSPLGHDHRIAMQAWTEGQNADTGGRVQKELLRSAASSHAQRGDTRRAFALLAEGLALPDLDSVTRAVFWFARSVLFIRIGRLADAELLLRDVAAMKASQGVGNESSALVLADSLALRGELAMALGMLEEVAGKGRGKTSVLSVLARAGLQTVILESGAVSEGLEGLQIHLEEASTSRRDSLLYTLASTYADCVIAAHEAGNLSPGDILNADSGLRSAQGVAISISGDDPPWYHALYPMLRGRILALVPERTAEAIDLTRTALALCERVWSDAVPLLARTLTTHLIKAGRYEEALAVIERAMPQMVEERFLEELARVQAAKLACLVRTQAPTPDVDTATTSLRATLAEMDAPRITADTLLDLGLVLLHQATHPDALSLLEEARDLFADMPIVAKEARCLEAMGDIATARGKPEEARPHYHAAKGILERHGLNLRVPLLEKKLAGA